MDKHKSESTDASGSSLSVRSMESTKLIPVSRIDPNRHQPRHEVAAEDVEELAESIKANGLIDPLVVSPNGKRYQLISEYQRFIICKTAGLAEMSHLNRTGYDTKILQCVLVESIQRIELTLTSDGISYDLRWMAENVPKQSHHKDACVNLMSIRLTSQLEL